ncbi:MAG: hypothetical protein HY912_06170 [Desulfomonile tiedjei]|uniref:Uncharacterized protein n=1 Tax=Desulfomonile tiedjei TaxID=2358 RepID=A0A9D6V1L3_9BACT|nr:hypothetical protein [Desulfomonile tiedjei]
MTWSKHAIMDAQSDRVVSNVLGICERPGVDTIRRYQIGRIGGGLNVRFVW